jgi:hypothetical protein
MSVYPHKHDNAAPIYKDKDGRMWVSHADILANEYEYMEDFSIVYLNGRFYELQAYVQKANAWWIEPVSAEDHNEVKGEAVSDGPTSAEEEAESPQAASESGEETLRPDDSGAGQ